LGDVAGKNSGASKIRGMVLCRFEMGEDSKKVHDGDDACASTGCA